MPILQNKLIIKSIEALHDEALALLPDEAKTRDVSAPPNFAHAITQLQEVPIKAAQTTVANAPPKSAVDQDIMARIDHLLEKLDEDDDVEVTPVEEGGRQSNSGDMTNNTKYTATPDKITKNNPTSPDNPKLSTAADHANKNTMLNADAGELAKDTSNKLFSQTGDNASNEAGNDMFSNDQLGEATPPDQTQALADIAEAIYQARQHAADSEVTDARQNNAVSLDIDALSAAVSDEVRRTISEVIMAELPQMVRHAVGETIRALPPVAHSQSKSTNSNSRTTKSVSPRKTATVSKALKTGTKKAGGETTTTKKAIDKATPHKKRSTRKSGAKKTTTKKAIDKTTPHKKRSTEKGNVNKTTVRKTAAST